MQRLDLQTLYERFIEVKNAEFLHKNCSATSWSLLFANVFSAQFRLFQRRVGIGADPYPKFIFKNPVSKIQTLTGMLNFSTTNSIFSSEKQ